MFLNRANFVLEPNSYSIMLPKTNVRLLKRPPSNMLDGPPIIEKIISGGQTGVDRAALVAAKEYGYPIGGWCPKGRRAEDGVIPAYWPLIETPSDDYSQRTKWNVRDSDGTLILNLDTLDGGTLETLRLAQQVYLKPVIVVQLGEQYSWVARRWLEMNPIHPIHVLNIAGPRESKRPGVYDKALYFLRDLLGSIQPDSNGLVCYR